MKPHILLLALLGACCQLHGQAFLNGDFETNAETTCNFNMGNLGFSMSMSFVTAFGLGEEMDIQTSGCGYGTPFSGNWFVSLANSGLNPDAISLQLNQPLVAGTSYTFFYHDQANTQFTNTAPLLIGLSTVPDAFGTQIFTALPAVGVWTQRTVTFTAPNNGQFITIQSSPGVTNWNFVDNFYFEECGASDVSLNVTGCEGDVLVLDATTPNATYEWPDGSDLPTFEVTASGVYNAGLTVNGCSFNMIYTVNFVDVVVDFGNDLSICQGDNIVLDPGIPGAAYTWQDGSTGSTFNVTQSGLYSVEAQLGSCTTTDEIEVLVNPLPSFDLGPDQTLCPGTSTTLDATTAGASYLWQNGSTNPTITVSTAGQYSVNVTVNGCTSSDQVNIGFHPNEDSNFSASLCEGQTFELADGTSVSQSGTYTVITTSATTGCHVTIVTNLIFNPPTFSTVDVSVCQGQLITLPDGNQVGQPGTYTTVLPSPVTGCPHTTTTNLVTFPGFTTSVQAAICQGESFTLPNGTTVTAAGSYPVVFSTAQGCDSTVVTQLTVFPSPSVSFTFEPERLHLLEPIAQFNAETANVATLQWDFSGLGTSQSPTAEFIFPYDLPGFYEVCLEGTSDFGCKTTVCRTVEVYTELNFWCPSAFTPDDDGTNDVFKPVVNGHRPNDYLFEIFDRWGQKIFSTTDPEMGWTGNHTGGSHYVQNDIYFWHAKVQPIGADNRQIFTGHVMLIR